MKSVSPRRRKLILYFSLPFLIICGGFAGDFFQYSKQLDIFANVYREVNTYYVDEVNPGDLMKTAINGMLGDLDPYTNYYPESEIEDYRMKHVSTEYGGVGASSFMRGDSVMVYDVIEGMPAQLAGLRAGDVVQAVNGRSLKGLSPEEVDEMMKGQSGTTVRLKVQRFGEAQPLEINITRTEIKVKNVSYYTMLNDSTGYIKLDKFLQNCYDEMRTAFLELKKNQGLKALVFDLRGNGGGLLEESVNILNLWIKKEQLMVTQKGKISGANNTYYTRNEPVDTDIRIVVLVDKNSASASEITAGNFQDIDRGVVVGQRSYGKGLVQQTRPLTYNSQMKVTVAKYYTASGRCVQTKIYTHEGGADSSFKLVSDSTIKPFKTAAGRTVYDGSAVYPDVYVPLTDTSNIGRMVYRQLLVFDYATRYRSLHPSIDSVATFHLSDADYQDFIAFTTSRTTDYKTETESAYAELKEQVIKDKYYASISKELDQLGSKLKHDQRADLLHFKDEIVPMLEQEIIRRYYYEKGSFKFMFVKDKVFLAGINTVNNVPLYTSILKGEGDYKVIGKPTAK
jgi:carboxyl-terminal processing protease